MNIQFNKLQTHICILIKKFNKIFNPPPLLPPNTIQFKKIYIRRIIERLINNKKNKKKKILLLLYYSIINSSNQL